MTAAPEPAAGLAETRPPRIGTFDNSYARLPERFHARLAPTPVARPRLVRLNVPLARALGLDAELLASPTGAEILAGNLIPDGAQPIAAAYAGHQFGGFVPQLGDGRAILLGEVIDRDGQRRDVQLKGSGPTPFSRSGDGRAALGPVIREYVVSEAMAALGIPTTRALAAVATGEPVFRETALPGAVLTRIAASHIRVGTFQYFAARGDAEAVRVLADHVIDRHYPGAREADNPVLVMLEGIAARQADLVARWMLVGFIHGVMNTDNMAVSGETIDYGPCAFMDTYHPGTVYSSIDRGGRYAWANQPRIAQWNLARLAETLLALLADSQEAAVALAEAVLDRFADRHQQAFVAGLNAKLGLTEVRDGDIELGRALLDAMAGGEADFTLTFRRLADTAADPAAEASVAGLFKDAAAFTAWAARWRERLAGEPADPQARAQAMRRVNPAFIPRNHLVEEAIQAAVTDGDTGPFEMLVDVLARPYDDRPGFERYQAPPQPHEVVHRTFCGT